LKLLRFSGILYFKEGGAVMEDLTIRQIFPQRLLHYMRENGKSRNDLVNDLGFKYSTVRDWEKGITVPRMDKVELLANYFHCSNADLLEMRVATEEDKKNSDAIVDITKALFKDDKLCAVVSFLCSAGLDESKLANVKDFIEFQMKR
jgi:transcriptional regulator with XRE-family HTH domain